MKPNLITRRELLGLALTLPVAHRLVFFAKDSSALDLELIKNSKGRVVTTAGTADDVRLIRQWRNAICQSQVVNQGTKPVRIKEVVLFDLDLPLPPETQLYGEGFQMLSQTGGTLGAPADLGNYTDAKHYKMPTPDNNRVVHGMISLSPTASRHYLMGFTSCRRFNGQFYLQGQKVQAVVDTEGRELGPGKTWPLEDFTFRQGPDRDLLLANLARSISRNHKRQNFPEPPTGWCSWYSFGPRVTAQQVLENLDFIAKNIPGLKYVQIDDGYQPAMGDWLETGNAFGGDVRGVLKQIRARGFEPAIWVAPFIAEEKSNVFQQHPDWFVKDENNQPLRSDRVTFGGWRRGPWYALDGTHPQVQKHFEHVFSTMRRKWGCTYFKLDANFWGAIHGGHFHEARATRIEAYRRGMEAILRGTEDGFVLGCNHPIWPSLGLIHGSRSSNDVKRTWERFKTIARQNLSRNWQNGSLWWNDPDAIVLMGDQPLNEFLFHATTVFASGGMILSGDDLSKITTERLAILRKLMPPTGIAATFEDHSLRVGRVKRPNGEVACLLNWEDGPQTMSLSLPRQCEVKDFWSDEKFGRRSGILKFDVPARSARMLVCA